MLPSLLVILGLFGLFEFGLVVVVLTARWAFVLEERVYLGLSHEEATERQAVEAVAARAV